MKFFVLSLFAAFAAGAPVLAAGNPDFERDAKPILAAQPGLVRYVHTHFVVRETGVARMPGNGEQPPQPPFIFNARPRGTTGPFYLRLLIQPGPEGRILKVADVRQLAPGQSQLPPKPETPETAPSTDAPASPSVGSSAPVSKPAAASSSNPQPTSDTPSGPIRN